MFDAVLLVGRARFTENERYLLTECTNRHIPCYLVRTAADVDAANDAEDRELPAPDDAGVTAQIRARVTGQIGAQHDSRLFVVSGRLRHTSRFNMMPLLHAFKRVTGKGKRSR